MTPTEFATFVRLKTKTNSTTFVDADILAFMAVRQDEIAEAILKADEDILLVPQYTDLKADQRDYMMPSDILTRIKRVEAKLDGTNWIPLTEIDITRIDYPIVTEANITSVFNNSQLSDGNSNGARFDILRKSLSLYSGTIIDVTDGLRLWCDTYPTAVTDLSSSTDMSVDPSTTTHGIPRSMHRIWAKGVIIDYKESKDKPIPLTEREQAYEFDLQKAIQVLKHGNLDREVIGDLPSSSTRGYEGYDY